MFNVISLVAILALILLLLIILIITGYFLFLRKKLAKNKISNALSKIIADVYIPNIENETEAKNIWLDVLKNHNYLDTLYKNGSMIILGTAKMGTSITTKWIAAHLNKTFNSSRRFATYLNFSELTGVVELTGDSQPIEECFPEEIYRSIFTNIFSPLLYEIKSQIGENAFATSGLKNQFIELQDQLSKNIVDLSPIENGKCINQILEILDISHLKICMDNITIIQKEKMPMLFRLLFKTFESSNQVDIIINGELNDFLFMTDSPAGPIGIQYGHDIFLSLNLKELLLPPTTKIQTKMVESGPRAAFVERSIIILSNSNLKTGIEGFSKFFNPPDLWKTIFNYFEGDIDKAYQAIGAILNYHNNSKQLITKEELSKTLIEIK